MESEANKYRYTHTYVDKRGVAFPLACGAFVALLRNTLPVPACSAYAPSLLHKIHLLCPPTQPMTRVRGQFVIRHARAPCRLLLLLLPSFSFLAHVVIHDSSLTAHLPTYLPTMQDISPKNATPAFGDVYN